MYGSKKGEKMEVGGACVYLEIYNYPDYSEKAKMARVSEGSAL